MRQSNLAVTLCIIFLGWDAHAQQRPAALERVEAYRGALRTAHVEWSVVGYRENLGPLRGVTRFMTSSFAEDARMSINRGDEDGVVVRQASGTPFGTGGTAVDYRFQTDDGVWERKDADLQPATLFTGKTGVSDLRSLGAACCLETTDIHDVLWRDPYSNPVPWRYEESREGDLRVVRVRKADSTVTYWLDPQRAWSPVRVRLDQHKYGWWAESQSSLKEMDGVWFPETVQFFHSTYEEGRKPTQIVRVYGATFNRPEHPQHLTLADIGVEVGTYVNVIEYNSQPRMGRWDGEEVIDVNEFARRKLEEGPGLKQQLARHLARRTKGQGASVIEPSLVGVDALAVRRAVSDQPAQYESLWESYTRNFIEMYQLNEDQTQKALSVLRSCQQRGHAHLGAHSAEFAELEKRVRNLGQQVGAAREREQAAIRAERERLAKPLDDIFEQRLKPRLDKLPTRAQRKAAEQADSKKEARD